MNAGETLGPYVILGPLGAGGMGEVFHARDSRLRREVAIKILPEQISENPSALSSFKREAKVLASLTHPNIVTIYEFEIHDSMPFVVMELLPGEPLRKTIARSALPWREAAGIAAAVSDGLAAAHSKGVIHRNLKPENIFLTPERAVKILDFGLARFHPAASSQELSSAPTESRMTETGIVKGTVPYMSPEQVRGSHVDERSDIFSLGCVLYEMLSGQRTFPQTTAADTMAAILKEDPPDLMESGIHIPLELDHIVQRCLRKDPDQRFQNARDLGFALHEISETRRAERLPLAVPRRAPLSKFLLAGFSILAIAALLIGLNIGGLRDRIWGTTDAGSIRSLAVLPLDNLSGDPKQEYFANGMTEELIAKLALIESLHVISRTSVMEYKDARKPLPQIAKELNVDAVIEGSVLQIGNQVKITAQLIHASSDRHLWAQTYQRDIRDVFALQNEVASAIADQIKLKLSPQQQTQFAGARPVQPDAYQAYLRGLDFMGRHETSEEDFRQAAQLFQRAVEIDPGFAIAYAELAKTHAWTYAWYDHTPERLAMAKAAVDRAFELQPDLPEAHHALGNYYYFGFYDYDKALKREGSWPRALVYYLKNDPRQAVQTLEARRADSENLLKNGTDAVEEAAIRSFLGFYYALAGRKADAIREGTKAVELWPVSRDAFWGTYRLWGLTQIYIITGEYDAAIDQIEYLLSIPSDLSVHWLRLDPLMDPLRNHPRFQKLLKTS